MAGSMAAAIDAAFQNPEFERRVQLVVDRPEASPTPPAIDAAFRRYDYDAEIRRAVRTVTKKFRRQDPAEAEEAVSTALANLFERRPELFEGPPDWMGLLVKVAGDVLGEWRIQRTRFRLHSIEHIYSAVEDAAFGGARLIGSGIPSAEIEARDVDPPGIGEEWTRTQGIGAVQRFYYREGRAPVERDFVRANELPSQKWVKKEFGSINPLLRAAGLQPTMEHRPKFTAEQAATKCAAFYRREGFWPTAEHFRYARDFDLPSESAAKRFFGGLNKRAVQLGVEAILTPEEIKAAR